MTVVKSVRGAVPVFRPARFPGPLPEPAVRLSPQRALRKPQVACQAPWYSLVWIFSTRRPPVERGFRIAGVHRRNLLIFQTSAVDLLDPQGRPPARYPRVRTLFRRPPTEPGMRLITAPGSPVSIPRSPATSSDPSWIPSWQSRQTIRVLRRRDAICWPSRAVRPDPPEGGLSGVECGALRRRSASCRARSGRTSAARRVRRDASSKYPGVRP